MTARLAAGLGLGIWLMAGLALTLGPVRPAPGQVVDDNIVPFRTIAIYLANPDSWFWVRNAIGNVLLLLPIGLLGPIVLPALDRWTRVLLVSLALSLAIEAAQLWIPNRSADVDDVLVNVLGALLGYAILNALRPGPGRRGVAVEP